MPSDSIQQAIIMGNVALNIYSYKPIAQRRDEQSTNPG